MSSPTYSYAYERWRVADRDRRLAGRALLQAIADNPKATKANLSGLTDTYQTAIDAERTAWDRYLAEPLPCGCEACCYPGVR